MSDGSTDLRLGARVYGSDGQEIGTVARIWWPGGPVEPPEDEPEGLIDVGTSNRALQPGMGYFQIDRFFSADWYAPFSAIASSGPEGVTLNVTSREAEGHDWQEKPGKRL